jgi:hypothetical protein
LPGGLAGEGGLNGYLDEDFHAPLSLKLLNGLCAGDETKTREAVAAANSAVNARIEFWDGVLAAIRAAG